MKTPRNPDADDLLKLLRKTYGYHFVGQAGSHIRIRTEVNGEHFLTIPNHSPIKTGTLNQILSDIAEHFRVSKQEIVNDLSA